GDRSSTGSWQAAFVAAQERSCGFPSAVGTGRRVGREFLPLKASSRELRPVRWPMECRLIAGRFLPRHLPFRLSARTWGPTVVPARRRVAPPRRLLALRGPASIRAAETTE